MGGRSGDGHLSNISAIISSCLASMLTAYHELTFSSRQFVRVLLNMAQDLGFFSIAWTILILAFRLYSLE